MHSFKMMLFQSSANYKPTCTQQCFIVTILDLEVEFSIKSYITVVTGLATSLVSWLDQSKREQPEQGAKISFI
jgi:hypothetical protein